MTHGTSHQHEIWEHISGPAAVRDGQPMGVHYHVLRMDDPLRFFVLEEAEDAPGHEHELKDTVGVDV